MQEYLEPSGQVPDRKAGSQYRIPRKKIAILPTGKCALTPRRPTAIYQ